MKAILTVQNHRVRTLVTTLWTPIFVGIFLAIVADVVARNQAAFDEASKLPLREE